MLPMSSIKNFWDLTMSALIQLEMIALEKVLRERCSKSRDCNIHRLHTARSRSLREKALSLRSEKGVKFLSEKVAMSTCMSSEFARPTEVLVSPV